MQKKLKPKNDTIITIESLTSEQFFDLMGYEIVDQGEFNDTDGEFVGVAYEFKNVDSNK